MTVEVRFDQLEQRVKRLETDRDSHADKLDQVLHAVVDMHEDVRRLDARIDRLDARFDRLYEDLPAIIARAVAPLLPPR